MCALVGRVRSGEQVTITVEVIIDEQGVSGLVPELEEALLTGQMTGHIEHIEAREAQ